MPSIRQKCFHEQNIIIGSDSIYEGIECNRKANFGERGLHIINCIILICEKVNNVHDPMNKGYLKDIFISCEAKNMKIYQKYPTVL